jgi:hypothetical protein
MTMSKIRKEAKKVIAAYKYLYDDGYILDGAEVSAYEQAKRVLLLDKIVRLQKAAMKLRNYYENDAAWAMYEGVYRGGGWYWFIIDCCELNANILWTKAAELYKQAENI